MRRSARTKIGLQHGPRFPPRASTLLGPIMKSHCLTLMCVFACCGVASHGFGSAYAYVGGDFNPTNAKSLDDTEPILAQSSLDEVNPSTHTDNYTGFAQVNGAVLKASARLITAIRLDQQVPNASRANWNDDLTLDNAAVFAGFFQTGLPYAYFRPTANGTIGDLAGAAATLSASVTNSLGVKKSGSDTTTSKNRSTLNLNIAFPLQDFNHPISYSMTLSTQAASITTLCTFVNATYSHTATLPPIIFADQFGMPIPGMPQPQISGSSGLTYAATSTQMVPLGDYNNNGIVDSADYVVWRNSVGQTANLAADGNGDGQVNTTDYTIWRLHFGQSTSAGQGLARAQPVPEPATALLFVMALPLLAQCAR